MTTKKFSEAMNELEDRYVTEAITYQRSKKKRNWFKWVAAAACICLVLAGLFPLFHQPGVSPFVLTAYALGNDNSLSAVTMQEGENIPVSMFEADNGMWGFVFSHEADDPELPISVSVINADQQLTVDEKIETISGLEMESTQKYVFFIPPQNEAAPYSLPLTMEDESVNTVALITVVIEQNEGGYIARIDEVTIHERREAPPMEE